MALVTHKPHKLWKMLIKHMQTCEVCKVRLGYPLAEINQKLCWQAQQYIAKGKLLDG